LHNPELEGILKDAGTNAAAAKAALKNVGTSNKGSSSSGSRHRQRSSSAGSQKGSGRHKKPSSRSAAVAEIMGEYEATVATVITSGYVDDEEFDFSRRDIDFDTYNAVVGVQVSDSDEDHLPALVHSSESECEESDDSVHSGIADSLQASEDDLDGEMASAARHGGSLKGRMIARGRQKLSVSWGNVESKEFVVDASSAERWRSVARRPRNSSYRHDVTRRRLAGTEFSAREAAKRLSWRLGTFMSNNIRRRHMTHEKSRLQHMKLARHSVAAPKIKKVRSTRMLKDGYPKQLIADTGAGVNLMSKSELGAHELKFVEKLARPIKLNTANGVTTTDEVLPLELPSLDDTLDFVLLENTPAVVSVGERCMTKGYGFYWPPNGDPFFVLPGGDGDTRRVVPLKTTRHVPMIVNGGVARRVPKGWIRRRLRIAADGDSQESSDSEHAHVADSDGDH